MHLLAVLLALSLLLSFSGWIGDDGHEVVGGYAEAFPDVFTDHRHFRFLYPAFLLGIVDLGEDMSEFPEKSVGWMRARTVLGLLIFIIPSMIALVLTLKPKANSYMEDYWGGEKVTLMDQRVSQEFTAAGETVGKLKFRLIANENNEPVTVTVRIADNEEGKDPLYEKEIISKDYFDGERIILKPGIEVTPGKTYYVVFTSKNQKDEGAAVLMTCDRDNGHAGLLVNGKAENAHVVMDVIN